VEEIIRNILEETQSQGTEASEEGSKFVRVKHPIYDDDSWEIQRNVRAVEEYTEHEVVWTEKASGSLQEERRVQNETGAGLGLGFVQSLQLDDRIAVVARALVSQLLKSWGLELIVVCFFSNYSIQGGPTSSGELKLRSISLFEIRPSNRTLFHRSCFCALLRD